MSGRANRRRGEIEAELGGARYTLCLTLGALAELETAFGVGDLVALAARFESGRLSARDLLHVIAAGLRGAGHALSDDEAAALNVEGGLPGYVAIAAALIGVTFGGLAETPPHPMPPQSA